MAKRVTKKNIKQSLFAAMIAKGMDAIYFTEMIEEYMFWYDVKLEFQKDIKNRGAVVSYDNGGGQTGMKKNDSINEMVKVSRRMSAILKQLEIDYVIELDPGEEEDDGKVINGEGDDDYEDIGL